MLIMKNRSQPRNKQGNTMSDKAKNMRIWEQAKKTDENFTKENRAAQGGSTSINTTYMFRRATEIFGPVGMGWGYEIFKDEITDGATKRYGPESEPLTMTEKIHTLGIKFWYMQGDKRGELYQYGHTDFVQMTRNGPRTESEPQKKSLSDAIKKSLSMLGFSADIFTGLFDDQSYRAEAARDIQAEAAEANIDRQAEKVVEFNEWIEDQIKLITEATNDSALKLYHKKAIRTLAERLSYQRISQQQHDKGVRAITKAATDAAQTGGEIE